MKVKDRMVYLLWLLNSGTLRYFTSEIGSELLLVSKTWKDSQCLSFSLFFVKNYIVLIQHHFCLYKPSILINLRVNLSLFESCFLSFFFFSLALSSIFFPLYLTVACMQHLPYTFFSAYVTFE